MNYLKNNRKIIELLIMFIVSIAIIIFTYNNYYLYKNSILKITNIENIKNEDESSKEIYYEQKITGIIKNGKYKDKIMTTENYTSTSGVYDEQLKLNSELFVDIDEKGENILSITGIKRDKYLAIMLVLFFDLLIIIGNKKGLKTLLSLSINIFLSIFVVFFYQKYIPNINILLVFIPTSILFIIISLFITNGNSKKTYSAILGSIISLLVSFTLSYILINIYEEKIPYWFMDYIEAVEDYKNIFNVNILLCGLGAIMDIAITMTTSINELISKNNNIRIKTLFKSGREISKDIVGTMINVMFFTIYSSMIPFALLVIKNNIPISSVLSTLGEIEMIRILTSSISIVLSIPISLYVAILILRGKKLK